MDIAVVEADCTEHRTPLLVVKVLEGEPELVGPIAKVDERLSGQISDVIARGDFKGREGQTLLIYPRSREFAAERILLVGIGKREKVDTERLRRGAATAVKQAMKLEVDRIALVLHHAELVSDRVSPESAARAVAEGVILGSFVFDELKTKEPEDGSGRKLELVEILEKVPEKVRAMETGARVGGAVARAENHARRLGNLPGNIATPSFLADRTREIAGRYGMKFEALGREELRRENLHALLAVAQGSDQEPRLIILEHRKGKSGGKPLVLIGKGLTFDAGGISIKPALGMEEMKFDMCGGAAVIAAMQAIGELDLPIDVVGIVPSSENLVSGGAMKPGDVIGSHMGKSIEVVNTDAEGRLILADAISYAKRFEPAAIIDAATLTGSCVIALGHHASGALGNDEGLLAEIREAGEAAGERVWPLPMFDEYREQLKSDYADLKNTGGRPGGTITAAWFLREFVGDTPWVHLDIAGTAYGDGKISYQSKGATGVPTRLLAEWVMARAG